MKCFQTYPLLVGLMLLGGTLSVFNAHCMQNQDGLIAQAGKATGQAIGTFGTSIAAGFAAASTNTGYRKGDAAKAFNKIAKTTIEELKQIDAGPAVKDLKNWLAHNQRVVIKNAILAVLIGSLVTATALGMQYATFFIWKYGSEVFAKYILMRMEKPRVIINSSTLEHPGYMKQFFNFVLQRKPTFDEMVFAPDLAQQLDDITKQTLNINKTIRGGKNITYRNLLLWGPPGTGKTMFARQLARKSNLEWVEITGSSLFTKGAGIAAIDELFEWANKAKKGLLIFIDEADSLLPDRSKMDPNSENYKIINHFLNYLGTKSNKFMIVMSTNHKIMFDPAMRRRIHDSIQLPLPGLEQRVQLLNLYAQKTLFNDKLNGDIFAIRAQQELTATKIKDIATQTEGFSSDEVATLIETIKSLADISDEGIPTKVIIDRAVKRQLDGRQGFITASTAS